MRTYDLNASSSSGIARRAVGRPAPRVRSSRDAEIARIERVAKLMDSRFGIPGTRFRFGLDSLIGLIPGVGDAVTALPAIWTLWQARRLGVSRRTQIWMVLNTLIDFVLGSVPVVGDIFDFAFKAHRKNFELLRKELER